MGKRRRTKKQKLNPKRPSLISWSPKEFEAKNNDSEANVKRHLISDNERSVHKKTGTKLAIITDKNGEFVSVKKDLLKSLGFAFLIIASEVVIYLIWR